MILGSAGAGKSTMAIKLGEITGIPVIHLDRLFWNPGWIATPKDEFDSEVFKAATGDSWIIDGNYSRTLDFRIEQADTIIFIDFNRYFCIYRIFKRWVSNRGRTRFDLGEDCPEKMDWPFLKWVWGYPTHSRKAILDKLHQCDKNVYHLKSRKAVAGFIDDARRGMNYSEFNEKRCRQSGT